MIELAKCELADRNSELDEFWADVYGVVCADGYIPKGTIELWPVRSCRRR